MIVGGQTEARAQLSLTIIDYHESFDQGLLCFVCARAHVRALMTQKSCAVGMRNAKLGNHLKVSYMMD